MRHDKRVFILNPPPNGSRWTGRNRAERFVRTGRAVFVGENSVRFVDSDPRNQAATEQADRDAEGYDLASSMGLANLRAIRNLPTVGNPLILLTRKQRRK
jgi:hypothetical protein